MDADSASPSESRTPDPHDVAALLGEVLALATHHHDPSRVCSGVSAGAAGLPGVGAAGVLVRGSGGALVPVGASGEQAHLIDLLESSASSRPAVDCMDGGRPVAVEDLDAGPGTDWHPLSAVALPLGLRSAYALPLTSGRSTFGVLHLFGGAAVPNGSLSVGRTLADVATLSLLGADPDIDATVVARRLHLAIAARITVEQAKGVLAARYAITPETAFGRLMAAAHATVRPLAEVATAVVERTTDPLLDAALATRLPPES